MRSDRTSGNPAVAGGSITEAISEEKSSPPDESKEKSQGRLDSFNNKVKELALVKDKLLQMIGACEKDQQDGGRFGPHDSPPENLSGETLTEPELNYRLSSLLDLLRELHGFGDCGVFLLKQDNTSLEKLVVSPGPAGYTDLRQFEGEVDAQWKRGRIAQAIDQKRRMVLSAKGEVSLVVIPFRVLDQRDGFWVAHLRGSVLADKNPEELLCWMELISSCVENHCLKQSFLRPQNEMSAQVEPDKLFTTVQLAKAMVHEISNSLQIIVGRTQLLRMSERKSKKPGPSISNLETIESTSNLACSMLKNFSDYLHRQFDKTTDAGEVNLQHILKSNLGLIEYILKSRKIKLDSDLGDNLPSVYGSPGNFEQAFLTLIWEIRELLTSGGSIRLCMTADPDWLYLDTYCAGKEGSRCDWRESADLEASGRLKTASEILEKYGGELNREELEDGAMRFSLRFPVAKRKRENPERSPESVLQH